MPSMGSGAAEGLQDVLQRLFYEAESKRQGAERQRQIERQSQLDVEGQRRWNAEHQLRQQTWDRTVAQDRTKAEKDAADAAGEQAALDTVLNDPSVSPASRNLLRLGRYGLGANLNVHALETPEAHTAHETATAMATDDRAFGNWKRQQDYADKLQRGRTAVASNLRMMPKDDPALPLGSSRYISSLPAKHQGNYQAAVAELNAYLQDPQTQRDHPNLDPIKAFAALQAASRQPAGGSPNVLDSIVQERPAFPGAGGGRGGGSGRPPGTSGMSEPTRAPATADRAVSLADLQAIAQRRGTSVEQERQRATAAGYVIR